MTAAGGDAEQLGRQAEQSDTLDHLVSIGLVAYGIVHLMLGWLAAQLVVGASNEDASTTGALTQLARQPFGTVLVWGIAFGLFLLVIWRLIEAAFGHREEEGTDRLRKRLVSLLKAGVYAALAVSAAKVASGSGSSGGSQGMTAKVLEWPIGPLIVGAVGLAIIAYGAGVAWRGWTEKFAEHLDTEGKLGTSGAAYLVLGKVGYIAKGVSLALVGVLFVLAAVQHRASESGGLDQALEKVLRQPFGPVVIIAIGVGLACYGVFCFARARHLDR
jgi:type IV secretory pathway VirB2 component (pilin)